MVSVHSNSWWNNKNCEKKKQSNEYSTKDERWLTKREKLFPFSERKRMIKKTDFDVLIPLFRIPMLYCQLIIFKLESFLCLLIEWMDTTYN